MLKQPSRNPYIDSETLWIPFKTLLDVSALQIPLDSFLHFAVCDVKCSVRGHMHIFSGLCGYNLKPIATHS